MNKDNVKFTIATKQDGILTKIIKKDSNNQIVKDSSQCFLSHGTGEVISCEFKELPNIINNIGLNQCLIHGVPKNQLTSFEILSEKEFKNNPQPNAITRTTKYFDYPKDSYFICMFDVDPPEDHIKDFDVIGAITQIFPQFKEAAKIITHSTSSNIYLDGKLVKDSKGLHIYFYVKAGSDIKKFKEKFKKLAWITGFGFIKISKAGTMLERNRLFDEYVLSSERLDFVAGAKCEDGLKQLRPEPEYIDGTAFNIDEIPDLTPEEEQKYHLKVAEAKTLKKDEALEKRKIWAKETAIKHYNKRKKLNPNDNINLEQIEADLLAYNLDSLKFDLNADFILQLDDDSFVSVGDILSNKDKFDGVTLYDPFEPEEGKNKAIFYTNVDDDKAPHMPVINSQLHGGIVYRLNYTFSNSTKLFNHLKSIPQTIDINNLNLLINHIIKKQKLNDIEKNTFENICAKNFGIKKSTLKSMTPKIPDEEDARTHSELANDFIESDLKDFIAYGSSYYKFDSKSGIFKAIEPNIIEQNIGEKYIHSKYCKRVSDYKSLQTYIYSKIKQPNFFNDSAIGVPCKDGFYHVTESGIKKIPYSKELKQIYQLDIVPDWKYQDNMPMFTQYLNDCLNDTQQELLQEIAGCIFCQLAAKVQKAFFLIASGGNGKSQFIEILNSILPVPTDNGMSLTTAISPDRFESSYNAHYLAHSLFNICGDIKKTVCIPHNFKNFVTCDSYIEARSIYGSTYNFKPKASHLFGVDGLPQTNDNATGFWRRFQFVKFNNNQFHESKNKIVDLGKKIAAKEKNQFIAWALIGAKRLIENNYNLTQTKEHQALISQWQSESDMITAFINDSEVCSLHESYKQDRKIIYENYKAYCIDSGAKYETSIKFYDRLRAKFNEKRDSKSRYFVGIKTKHIRDFINNIE